jgi:hypothetical protein
MCSRVLPHAAGDPNVRFEEERWAALGQFIQDRCTWHACMRGMPGSTGCFTCLSVCPRGCCVHVQGWRSERRGDGALPGPPRTRHPGPFRHSALPPPLQLARRRSALHQGCLCALQAVGAYADESFVLPALIRFAGEVRPPALLASGTAHGVFMVLV